MTDELDKPDNPFWTRATNRAVRAAAGDVGPAMAHLTALERRVDFSRTARRFAEFARWRGEKWVRPLVEIREEWRAEIAGREPEKPSVSVAALARAMGEMAPRLEDARLFSRLPPPPAVADAPVEERERVEYVPLKERDPALWAKMSAAAGYRPCAGGCGEWLTEWDFSDRCDECFYNDAWRVVFGAQNRPQRRVIWLSVAP